MPDEIVIDAAVPIEGRADVYRLTLTGRIYSAGAATLEARIKQASDRGAKTVILDCSSLEALDSSALSAIIEGFKTIKTKHNGQVIFAALSPAITRILQLTRMEKFFPVAPDLAAAVALAPR
jgi:anti-anti-sigma factor